MKIAVSTVTLAAVVCVALVAPLARDVRACSIVTPADHWMPAHVERAPVVAIGHWQGVDAREVTFVVEQPLKGSQAGDRFPVDNRTTYTAFSCSPYDEPFREGYRFLDGERAVVMLEKQVDGLWRVGYLALAAFEVPESLDSPLQGIGWWFGDTEAGTQTDIRLGTIVAASGFEGVVSLEPPTELTPARPFVVSASPAASGGSEVGVGQWFGLALGLLLMAGPIAWRIRRG